MSNGVDSDHTTFGTLKVQGATPLPDLLDLFVAGGGPAGTAAAVRAKEYGLSCLVVDYDDLMKRIRDYPKEKLIKPSYGGGDKMPFPSGGPMLSALAFDDIDKDEMVTQWKAHYREFGLNAKVGSEFTGLRRAEDGTWEVKTWNHRAGKDVFYRARHVLIAMGAGVPRRFDIPGNTDGIMLRLEDAANYTGSPALVIGGGTSAAEAVISISNAKASVDDNTPVYWSYRGDRMPKVSKAIGEAFFDAYVGNGNIRYLAFSEPTAVVVGPDKQEYLSVQIDRKIVLGRPPETVHLEFTKSQVVACIGEDLPVRFLQNVGVKVPEVNGRSLMLVNQDGEVSLPGVFLVGDARGPRYLRCTSFEDSSSYEQVVQKRNIKAAMVEAVEAVEVIAGRSGHEAVKIERRAPVATPVVPPTPSEPTDARPQSQSLTVQLVALLPDGTPEEEFAVARERTTIGRANADVTCASDVYMADDHAVLLKRGDDYLIEDTGQGSGIWIRAQGVTGRPLAEGDVAWIGAQILVATQEGGRWALAHYNNDSVYQATYPLGERGLFVGRGSEVPLDPNDLTLSRRHAQFRIEGGVLKVFDLGSRNGTYAKVNQSLVLASGDEFRIASKRFRFERFSPVAKLAASDVVIETPKEVSAETPSAALAEGQFPVVIEHPEFPVSFGVAPGKDVLHAYFDNVKERFPTCKLSRTGEPAEHMDEPLGWECKVGLCGLCAVEIVEGAANLVAVDAGSPEMNTVANKAFLDADPNKYRLACLAKVKGPLKLKIPG